MSSKAAIVSASSLLAVEAAVDGDRQRVEPPVDRVEPFGVGGDRRPGPGAGDVHVPRELTPGLVDQAEHHVARALEVVPRFLARELDLLPGDLRVSGNRCELSVNSIGQLRHQLAQADDLASQGSEFLVTEDLVFSLVARCFRADVHIGPFTWCSGFRAWGGGDLFIGMSDRFLEP
ncbi:MAG: hypothetical protein R2705_24855 [Ilumatobacteraceae bacterium]